MKPEMKIEDVALEIATTIHEKYKHSLWSQMVVVSLVKDELKRLDKEFNEAQEAEYLDSYYGGKESEH